MKDPKRSELELTKTEGLTEDQVVELFIKGFRSKNLVKNWSERNRYGKFGGFYTEDQVESRWNWTVATTLRAFRIYRTKLRIREINSQKVVTIQEAKELSELKEIMSQTNQAEKTKFETVGELVGFAIRVFKLKNLQVKEKRTKYAKHRYDFVYSIEEMQEANQDSSRGDRRLGLIEASYHDNLKTNIAGYNEEDDVLEMRDSINQVYASFCNEDPEAAAIIEDILTASMKVNDIMKKHGVNRKRINEIIAKAGEISLRLGIKEAA